MKNKYLCLTDKCFNDFKEYSRKLDELNKMIPDISKKEYENKLYELKDNFKVEIDKEQLTNQLLILSGMLIQFSKYLDDPESFSDGWVQQGLEFSRENITTAIDIEILIEYFYKCLYYIRNLKFCDDMNGVGDKVAKAIRKENIFNEKVNSILEWQEYLDNNLKAYQKAKELINEKRK